MFEAKMDWSFAYENKKCYFAIGQFSNLREENKKVD